MRNRVILLSMPKIIVSSPEKMRRLGLKYAQNIVKNKKSNSAATIIALYGNLGSGKTVFAQGFGRGLHISKRIQSPTFVLMRRYFLSRLNHPAFKRFYHLDLYRIKNEKDTEYLALNEIFKDSSAIVLIEWADRIEKILPGKIIKIEMEHTKNRKHRKARIKKI